MAEEFPDPAKLLRRTEPLDDELVPYLSPLGNGMVMLRHPLVYSIPYADGMNAFLNAQFRMKQARINKLSAEGEWSSYLIFHERPWRVNAFLKIAPRMSDAEYWKELAWLWMDSENIWQNKAVWRSLLRSPRPGREHLLTDDERSAFEQLPNTVRVYRGCCVENRRGLSWTTDREKAEWFLERQFGRKRVLLAGEVKKKNVLAYFLGRRESEIVAEPRSVQLAA